MITVAGRACFGVYAQADLAADADRLAQGIDEAIDELLARCVERPDHSGPDAARRGSRPRRAAARNKPLPVK